MPIYEVRVEERHIETVEEIHRAYRDVFYEQSYNVEAENEEDARTNYESGDRIGERVFLDTGDYYDSEYQESGEVLESQWEDEDVVEVHNTETGQIHGSGIPVPQPEPAPPLQPTRSVWRVHATSGVGYYSPAAVVPAEPSWEV